MRTTFALLFTLLFASHGSSAVITGLPCVSSRAFLTSEWMADFFAAKDDGLVVIIIKACEKDSQCTEGMCCAVSLWIRSLRMCTPAGQEGDECHPMSHKIPFNGKRLHHTCPCLPNLSCITIEEGRSQCLSTYQYPEYL